VAEERAFDHGDDGGLLVVVEAFVGDNQIVSSPQRRQERGVNTPSAGPITTNREEPPIRRPSAMDRSETTDPMDAPSETMISGMTMAREIRTLTIGTGAVRAPFAGRVGR